MFYLIKVIILCLIISLNLTSCTKSMTNMKSKLKSGIQDPELKTLILSMFSQPECPRNIRSKVQEEKPVSTTVETGLWAIPRSKPNKYDSRLYGWGPSAYLFDYLDPVLEERILKIFEDLWKEVTSITSFPTIKEREDPYSLKNIFKLDQTDDILLEKFKALKPSFDKNIWAQSVTVPQVRAIAKDWQFTANTIDLGREIVDKYDFNGDGRLSRKEYIIAYLNSNRAIIGTKSCKTFKDTNNKDVEVDCIDNFVRRVIGPLFFKADCGDYDDKISAEEIWYAFKSLIRNKEDKSPETRFNIYDCIILNEPYHTTSINDFILKSQKTIDGYLNKLEFTRGIFLAYWARSVDDLRIYPSFYKEENSKTPQYRNMKNMRWSSSNPLDNKCILLRS
jgi:hypothetical protein